MSIFSIIFFISLLFGQLGAIRVLTGATVYIHDITLGLLLLSFFFGKKNRKIGIPKLVWFMPMFGIAALLSILAHLGKWSGTESLQSILYLARWIYYSLLFGIVLYSKLSSRVWIWGLYLTGVGIALIGLVQFAFYPSLANLSYLGWDPYYYRVFSTLLDPNFTGILLVMTLFLGAYIWNQIQKHWLTATSQILVGIAFILTTSRSSFVAFVVGVGVYTLIKKQWKLLAGCIVLFSLYLVIPKPTMEAFRLGRTVSAFARLNNWQQSFLLFQKEPILGTGFGNLSLISRDAHVVEDVPSKSGSGIDSSLLFVLATTGLVGFILYIELFKNIIMLLVHAMKKKKTRALTYVGCAWIASLFVHSAFTNSLFYPWVLVYVWILMGVIQKEVISDR